MMLFPEIFDGHALGFFTTKGTGTDVSHLTGRQVYFPTQEHTDIVHDLRDDLTPLVADAVITARDDVMLGIKVADCVPILLYDRELSVLGAVHAGWKGTAKGILGKAIKAMKVKYNSNGENIMVAIGPSIKGCCYEVGEDVFKAVHNQTGEGDYFRQKNDKYLLDLQEANRIQAISSGVMRSKISVLDECTSCHDNKYHSFRASAGQAGRQGGFIVKP